ncbi:MAG TPA: glycosyltransferase family 2 protein [Polyangiales bacterium]|nr:glycosyltransferase family 2 protein [Polyangiales bacterium]
MLRARRNFKSLELSILVPVFNEAESLRELHREITLACGQVATQYEVVFVDDGSSDGSADVLDELADADPHVVVIHLRRNFGKSPALAAGFEYVRGSIVITMDADLQDDPAMIPLFVERIRAGADLVSGWKQKRHDPLDKTLPSRVFNAAVSRLSGVRLRDFNCGFKAYRAECVRELRVYGGFHRFLPVFAHDRGFRVEELVVQHRARKHGFSKFGSRRFFEGLLDLPTVLLLTRYRTRPLHFFGLPGALVMLVGLGLLTYLSVLWFMGYPVGTRPLLTLGVLLTITGVQILCVGLVAEVIVRTTLGRAEVYAIRSVRKHEAEESEPEQPDGKLARK